MALYGLIGYPLTHSFSPAYFNDKFEREGIDAVYKAFPLRTINDLPALIEQYPQLVGLNVTIPYKEQVIPYLDAIDEAAKVIEAVNCIHISNDKRTGYNTDYTGFMKSMLPLQKIRYRHALVLGSGGASKAVQYALQQLDIIPTVVSRTDGDINYDTLTVDMVEANKLIVNTTPLGMYPDTDNYPPIPYHALGRQHLLYDVIYNPELTTFLKKGRQQGASIKNGYEMLVLQAEESWRIWNT